MNVRQIKAVMYVKQRGKITNKEYQKLTGVSKPTATRDMKSLVEMQFLKQQGITGKGTFYTLFKDSQRAQRDNKGLTKGSNPVQKSNKGTNGVKDAIKMPKRRQRE